MKKQIQFFTILFCLLFIQHTYAQTGVAINASGANADSSAMLDVSSNIKGFLIPRMTTQERDNISNPAIGLQIFNTTTNCLNFYTGTSWKQVCGDCDFNAPLVNNNGPICEGNTLNLFATSINGATYLWTGPNNFSSTQQNPSIPNASINASGTYSVEATVNGCSAQAQTTIATVIPTPPTPTATNDGPICVGDILNLTATTINGATYQWSGPNGYSASVQNPVISSAAVTHVGTYQVTASVNGCTSAAGSTTVAIGTAPSTPGIISGIAALCPNDTGIVYSIAAVQGATSYNWFVPAGANITINQDTLIQVDFGASPAGSISVSASNGCGTSATSTLAVSLGSTCSPEIFTYTGAEQTYTVPAGVTSITIEVWGASGGGPNTGSSQQAGRGGYSKGTLTVTPGETFLIYVGGQGEYQGNNGTNPIALGGWNGGGNSGACQASSQPAGAGGGSDVRFGGNSMNNRIIVAGGGGGCYANYNTTRTGGAGGGLVGGTCPAGTNECGGGSQTAGGLGGTQNGSFGQGGHDNNGSHECGGGGGGGWYGGGADSHGAGGGGSSYISGHTGCVPATHSSGKTFTNTSMQQGVRHGDGQIIISW